MRRTQFAFRIGERTPAQLVVLIRLQIARFSRPIRHRVQPQAPRIGRRAGQLAERMRAQRHDAEFFAKFADQSLLRKLLFFQFSAGKFPEAGHMASLSPLLKQDLAIHVQKRGGNDNHRRIFFHKQAPR